MTKFFSGLLLGLLIGFSLNYFYSPEDATVPKKDTITVQLKDQVIEMDIIQKDSIK